MRACGFAGHGSLHRVLAGAFILAVAGIVPAAAQFPPPPGQNQSSAGQSSPFPPPPGQSQPAAAQSNSPFPPPSGQQQQSAVNSPFPPAPAPGSFGGAAAPSPGGFGALQGGFGVRPGGSSGGPPQGSFGGGPAQGGLRWSCPRRIRRSRPDGWRGARSAEGVSDVSQHSRRRGKGRGGYPCGQRAQGDARGGLPAVQGLRGQGSQAGEVSRNQPENLRRAAERHHAGQAEPRQDRPDPQQRVQRRTRRAQGRRSATRWADR